MRKKKDDAVSPVIGVMLMLVVTIIIAAVVAVFASGVGTDAEPAPATVLNVVDVSCGKEGEYEITVDSDKIMEDYGEEVPGAMDGVEIGLIKGFLISPTEFADPASAEAQKYSKVTQITPADPATITIKSNGGDTVELAKLSVKVSDKSGNLLAESTSVTTSETISPGDTYTFKLTKPLSGKSVNVVILYGAEHVILNKEVEL